ncbi:hypothetical protein AC1031_011601 [Aphanomyces cochlioides]|nr:hypothetical protein AC1031_011601 [Aphanomyces cochlioides]
MAPLQIRPRIDRKAGETKAATSKSDVSPYEMSLMHVIVDAMGSYGIDEWHFRIARTSMNENKRHQDGSKKVKEMHLDVNVGVTVIVPPVLFSVSMPSRLQCAQWLYGHLHILSKYVQ